MVAHCVEEVTKKFDFVERYQIQPELKMKNCRQRDNPNQSAGSATLQGIFLVAGGHTFSVLWAMRMGYLPTMGAPLAPTAPGGQNPVGTKRRGPSCQCCGGPLFGVARPRGGMIGACAHRGLVS